MLQLRRLTNERTIRDENRILLLDYGDFSNTRASSARIDWLVAYLPVLNVTERGEAGGGGGERRVGLHGHDNTHIDAVEGFCNRTTTGRNTMTMMMGCSHCCCCCNDTDVQTNRQTIRQAGRLNNIS